MNVDFHEHRVCQTISEQQKGAGAGEGNGSRTDREGLTAEGCYPVEGRAQVLLVC